jgi:hypothetical protein
MRLVNRLLALALLLATLAGCASLPDDVQRPPSQTLVAPADAPLVRVASDAGIPLDKSAFWPMPAAGFALDARLSLIRQARSSLDLATTPSAASPCASCATRPRAACACACCLTTSTPRGWTRCCWAWPRTTTCKCGCSTPS